MGKRTIVFILLFFVFGLFFSAPKARADYDCLTLTISSSQADKDYCRSELSQIEAQLTDLLNKQKEQQKQTGTLKGDVAYLTSQINALKTKIKARALVIAQLKVDIKEKANTIESLSEKIDREHESLAQLLRNTNEFDEENIVHLILSDDSISNFYSDLESYASIKQAVKASVDIIRGVKVENEVAKKDLEKKQNAETDAKVELENAQKKVAQSEAEKKKLLAISKEKEQEYQKLAAEKKARADKIRNALFQLRDTKAIPFGTALEYAKEAQAKTGVRPAFLLAIITQETNLGANIGTCNRPEDPPSKNWKAVMKPDRDQGPFERITSALGLNPYSMPVSCPWNGGWGGAMGPSQFIPSTWELYATKVASALGISGMPNPWEPRHAFFASAIYLGELGADNGGYTAERTAALKYYAGSGWKLKKNAFYGDGVMKKAISIQTDIDLLSS
ncbi:MAG: lytic murein transglycosylase [Patescibacteria group bacterium]